MPTRPALLAVLALCGALGLLSGCGGGSSSGGGSQDDAITQTVNTFMADLSLADGKGACAQLTSQGQAEMKKLLTPPAGKSSGRPPVTSCQTGVSGLASAQTRALDPKAFRQQVADTDIIDSIEVRGKTALVRLIKVRNVSLPVPMGELGETWLIESPKPLVAFLGASAAAAAGGATGAGGANGAGSTS